jgi:hypothetical protein
MKTIGSQLFTMRSYSKYLAVCSHWHGTRHWTSIDSTWDEDLNFHWFHAMEPSIWRPPQANPRWPSFQLVAAAVLLQCCSRPPPLEQWRHGRWARRTASCMPKGVGWGAAWRWGAAPPGRDEEWCSCHRSLCAAGPVSSEDGTMVSSLACWL